MAVDFAVRFLHAVVVRPIHGQKLLRKLQMTLLGLEIEANLLVLIHVAVHGLLHAGGTHVDKEFHLQKVVDVAEGEVYARRVAEVRALRLESPDLTEAVDHYFDEQDHEHQPQNYVLRMPRPVSVIVLRLKDLELLLVETFHLRSFRELGDESDRVDDLPDLLEIFVFFPGPAVSVRVTFLGDDLLLAAVMTGNSIVFARLLIQRRGGIGGSVRLGGIIRLFDSGVGSEHLPIVACFATTIILCSLRGHAGRNNRFNVVARSAEEVSLSERHRRLLLLPHPSDRVRGLLSLNAFVRHCILVCLLPLKP